MKTATEFCTFFKIPPTSLAIHRLRPASAILARAVVVLFVILFIVAGLGNLAGAQSLGYVVNSTDGTVTVFGNATSTLNAQPFSEDTLQVVTFPAQAGQSAPKLVATAVAPAAGSNTPPARLVYVTDQQNNQLWAFDISTISQANAMAKPLSIAAGSCSPLFNQPGAIVIATPGSSVFAYVANQADGTVSIIDLAAASCVAKTAALGTITGIAASPDMNEVFVITATASSPALWVINTTTTPQSAAAIDMSPFKLVDPVSIAVQNDNAACYFITIGDAGNSLLFLAAVGPPAANADPNCPAGVTPTTAQPILSLTEPSITLPGSNPVGQVSTFAPGINGGNIYVADASNNEVWEIDCFVPNAPPVYTCNPSDSGPVALTSPATPTTIGISLAQEIPVNTTAAKQRVKRVAKHASPPAAEQDELYQYVYVAGTSSTGSVFDYSNVFSGGTDALQFFNSSAVTLGNGPQGLIFSGADPNDPPVTWFNSATGGNGNFSGTTWVMPVTGLLTALGSTVVNLGSTIPIPTLSLNFGTTAVNGLFASSTIFCAPFGGGTGEISCPGDSGVQGANAVGGQSSTTSGGQAGNLNLPASTVFTVTLEACSEAAGCPASPNPSTDTVLTQQISAGAVCTATLTPSPNTGLNNVAIGQTVNAELTCVAPVVSANAPIGDAISATITWAPNVTGVVSCSSQTCTLTSPVNGYQYENAAMPFPSNTYSAPGMYTVSISGMDTTENVPIFLGTSGSQTITVNGPTITVSPTGSASQPLQVQLLGTQAFSGTLDFSPTTPTMTWALTANGTACSPSCGTISNTVVTPIAGTLDYNISATYNAPSEVFAGTITLTVSANGVSAANGISAQAFIVTTTSTTTPPPSCSFSTPPTTGQTGLAVTVTLACTAPANDSVNATVDFSDGTPLTMTGTASGGTLNLTFSHTYANVGTYSVSVTSIADTTTGLSGTPPTAVPLIIYLTPTVTPVQSNVTLAPGQSATFALNFAGGLSDANVTFTSFACQNLPAGATCAFSPASITLDANGNSTNTLQVTVTLTGSSTSSRVVPPHSPQQILLVASLWGIPLFGIVFLGAAGKGRKGRRQAGFGLLLVLVLILMWIPACSSVTQSTIACPSCAAPGTYPVTVTASSVNPELTSTTVFTLVVEP